MNRKSIPDSGQSAGALFRTMEDFRAADVDWREGRTFGYVFDAGREIEDVAKRAFTMFMSENALDPTQFPSLLRFENDVVQMALSHLSAPEGASGNFTSGGTESILMACKAARDRFRALHPDEAEAPQMVLPVTAHAAFHKAACFLGLEVVPTAVDPESFEADPAAVRAAVGPRTALIVGSATSYAHGVIDPIEQLGAIAQEHDVPLHVDACIGGFLLPYFRRLGDDIPPYDFSVPGVTSMSMDYHKYAYCPKGASVVLYRDKDLRRHAIFGCARWTGYSVINTTMQSTKSGGPLAAAWAVLGFVGDGGYMEIARGLREATRRIVDGVGGIDGLRVLGDPKMSLVAVAADGFSVFRLADLMKQRGWYIQPQLGFARSPASFHLSVMPSNVPHVDDLLRDLGAAAEETKALPPSEMPAQVAQAFGATDPSDLGPDTLQQMLAMAGMGDGFGVPHERGAGAAAIPTDQEMADINEVLDALPRPLVERILKEYVNQLFA